MDISPRWPSFFVSLTDASVRLRFVEARAYVEACACHAHLVSSIGWEPPGYYFASAGDDRTARVCVADRTSPVPLLAGHLIDADTLAQHPNCSYVANVSASTTTAPSLPPRCSSRSPTPQRSTGKILACVARSSSPPSQTHSCGSCCLTLGHPSCTYVASGSADATF